MSKLSSVLPGEAPASPIIVAGSKCDCEFMRDGDGDVGLGLGGSTVYLWAKGLVLAGSFVLLFLCFLWVVFVIGFFVRQPPSCWGWISGAFGIATNSVLG